MEEIVFPNQLRMLRRVRGKRMQEIADLLGLSISALSKIEKGYRRLNEEQITKISEYLNCPTTALFVSDSTSQPEVLKAWQEEQDRRHRMNIGGGLQVLGSGLRYIRGQKKMTLNGVAKAAKLTLSVYHRIEMGQREVDEKTFANIARALGMNEEDLQLKIYELDSSGALDDLKMNTGKTGIDLFKGGYNDLPMSRLMMRAGDAKEVTLPITGTVDEKGKITMHPDTSIGAVLCPSTLANDVGLYAVRLGQEFGQLPAGTVLIISPTTPLRSGDWVVFSQKNEASLMRVHMSENKDTWQLTSFDHSAKEYPVPLTQLQKVVWIVLL